MTRGRTTSALALTALALAAPLAGAAGAATSTTSVVLPGAQVFPEGVTAFRDTFYVTSTTDGTLFRGRLGQSRASVFSPGGADGRTTAIGLEVTARGDRLVVAGGGTGQAHVYDTGGARLIARYDNGGTTPTFVNDVAISRTGDAYLTDSQRPVLYRIPAAQVAAAGTTRAVRALPVFLDLRGTAFAYREGFNANGIAITPDGRYALVVQSNTGSLFRIDLRTRQVRRVDLGAAALTNGDGLELRGDVLHVVRNANGVISKVKLSADASRGRVYGQIANGTFRFPTTAAFARGGTLLVVNSQFDKRAPGARPETFTVSVIR